MTVIYINWPNGRYSSLLLRVMCPHMVQSAVGALTPNSSVWMVPGTEED